MAEFALFIGGAFVETRDLPSRPDDIPHNSVEWHPVGEPVYGAPPGWAVGDGEAVQTVSPPPDPPAPTRLEKATLVRRMTSAEVGDMLAALDAYPDPKLAELYRATVVFDSTSPEYPALEAAFVAVLGEDRAAEVLGPEY